MELCIQGGAAALPDPQSLPAECHGNGAPGSCRESWATVGLGLQDPDKSFLLLFTFIEQF